MFAPAKVRGLLIEAARARQVFTYGALLNILGHVFTRPLMRQLCKVLDRIDEDGRAVGEPGLAVLVVRQSDERVLGVHMVGDDAAEIIQAIGIAIKMGVTKPDFDRTCAVHPSVAEELVTMRKPVRKGA